MRKILLALAIITSFAAAGQTPFPLYIPANPDSLRIPVNLNGATRTVYNIDLVKYRAAIAAHDTANAVRLLIPTNNNQLTNGAGYISDTTPLHNQIVLKADKSTTISINGSSQTLGSNPSFTVSGSGTASKQIWINLADYADSTGLTDATAGINNAIAATPDGGTLFVGPGAFKTNGGHVVTKKIHIIGSGAIGYPQYISSVYYFRRGASVIISTSTTATLLDLQSPASIIENIDFRLDSTLTATTAKGINVSAASSTGSSFRLINCSFYNFNIGVHIVNGGLQSIDKCFFVTNRTDGLRIENGARADEGDASISNSWFYGNMAFPGGVISGQTGIRQYSGGGLKVVNCKFNSGLTNCIDLPINGVTSIFQISNSSLENFYGYGIRVDPSLNFAYIQINGNEFAPYQSITGNCIYMNGAAHAVKDVVISSNIFFDENTNTNPAIFLNTVNGYNVSDNRFSGWANTLSTTGSTNGNPINTATGRAIIGTGTASTTAALQVPAFNTTQNNAEFGSFGIQSYALNNGFMAENAYFNGSSWTRRNTGYSSGFQFYNGQFVLSMAGSGTGTFTPIVPLKADYSGVVAIGGAAITAANNSYTGATMVVNGSGASVGTAAVATSALQTTSFSTGYATKTAAYTVTASDHTINCNGTSAFTITLPSATGITGRIYIVVNTGTDVITVTSASIIVSTSVPVGSAIQYQSTGSSWIKIN